jgi:hypothetical protein
VPRTDVPAGSPESLQVGIARFDLDTEKLDYAEVANAETSIFSAVVSPADKNQVFMVLNQIYHADMQSKNIVQRQNLGYPISVIDLPVFRLGVHCA